MKSSHRVRSCYTGWWPFPGEHLLLSPRLFIHFTHVMVFLYINDVAPSTTGILGPRHDLIIGVSKVIYPLSRGHYTTNGHLSGHFYSCQTRPLHRSSTISALRTVHTQCCVISLGYDEDMTLYGSNSAWSDSASSTREDEQDTPWLSLLFHSF